MFVHEEQNFMDGCASRKVLTCCGQAIIVRNDSELNGDVLLVVFLCSGLFVMLCTDLRQSNTILFVCCALNLVILVRL